MKLSRFWAVTQILFIGLLCAFSAQARQTVFAWDAVPSWPAGTTVELEANGASANGITTTQYTIDVPVQPGEVISFRVRAIPPAGYECGDPLSLCPPSDWAALSRTLPAAPTGLWANKELIGGGVMADPVFGGYGTVVNTGTSSASTLTSTITNVESGDLVIALVQRNYSATNLTGITCDGNAMTVVSTVNSGINDFVFYLYTYRATSAISSAAVVASFSDSQAQGSMITARWSNVSSATALGFQRSPSSGSGLTGPATTRTVPTALTTSERALIIAVGTDWYNTHTAANSFTKRFDNAIAGGGSSSVQFIYSRVADAGSFGAGSNFGTAASGQYMAILAAFPITAGGAATVSPNDMQHAQAMDAATLLQAHILAVSELLHSQALDNATITQAFTLTPSDAINTQAIDATMLLQQSVISPSELQQINSMDATALIQAHTLAITDLLNSQVLDNATITQSSTLAPNDALNAQSLDATTLLQQSVISPADLLQGNTLDATTLIQAHTLAIADITHAQTLDNVSLVVAGDISPDEMMTLQAMDAPLLLQAHIIAPNDALNVQSIDSPVIVQSNVLIPAGMDHAVILDSPVIVQANVISPSELLTAQAVDNVTLAVLGSLSVDDLLSSQAIESPGLTQAHTIAPNELTHVNSIDASELFQGFILVPADLLHEQEMEGALLDVIFGLSPADLLNAQGIESPGLIQAHVIFPADLLQANRFDVAGISSGLLQVPTGRAIVLGASDRYVLLTPADRFILLTKSTRVVS